MMALEDKLAASEATIAAQRDLLGARVAPAPSALDRFLESVEIGGHVSASYVYNFNNPDQNLGNTAAGTDHGTQPGFQFNTDHNTFALDAVKLEIGKPASEPGSAGFQVDLLFGENANILGAATPAATTRTFNGLGTRGPADSEVFVQEAYVSYNANNLEMKMGKFETLLGAEVLDSVENPNVTHGLIFTLASPLYHTGLLGTAHVSENMTASLAVVNGFNNVNDFGDNKGVIGQLMFGGEQASLSTSVFVGSEGTRLSSDDGTTTVGDNNSTTQIYNAVARFKPTDALHFWADAVYGYQELDPRRTGGLFNTAAPDEDAEWYGGALGVQFDLNERTYLALRGEWLRDDGGALIGTSTLEEIDMTSATATLGYKLTDNLLARLEYRHDTFDSDRPDRSPFGASDSGPVPGLSTTANSQEDQQDVGLIEVSYIFD
jgi:hypothetical protein